MRLANGWIFKRALVITGIPTWPTLSSSSKTAICLFVVSEDAFLLCSLNRSFCSANNCIGQKKVCTKSVRPQKKAKLTF